MSAPVTTSEGVSFNDAGELDEIRAGGGCFLERTSSARWCLHCIMRDGTDQVVWFDGCVTLTERQNAGATPHTYTASTMPRDEAAMDRVVMALITLKTTADKAILEITEQMWATLSASKVLKLHDALTIARCNDLNACIAPDPEADATLIETLRAEIAQLRADASDAAMRADRTERAAEVMRKALTFVVDPNALNPGPVAQRAIAAVQAIYDEAAQ